MANYTNENFPKLSEAEREIMNIVWPAQQPLTSNYIWENLTSRTWALSTVMSVLAKLCEKGFIYCDRSTRTNYYTAVTPKEEYLRRESRHFLKNMHQDSIASMVTALHNSGEITEEEIEKLRHILDGR